MPTVFKRADKDITEMANAIMCQFDSHQPLLDARVRVDFVLAYAEKDEDGKTYGHALSKNGVRALGICRKMGLKDRAMGRGDAEIALDGDHWESITEEEQRALLDHELHHIKVRTNRAGVALTDDLNRPLLEMRKHDFDFGFFNIIAHRHGAASPERQYCKVMVESAGQYLFPDFMATA